jgi:hypothetical protein
MTSEITAICIQAVKPCSAALAAIVCELNSLGCEYEGLRSYCILLMSFHSKNVLYSCDGVSLLDSAQERLQMWMRSMIFFHWNESANPFTAERNGRNGAQAELAI